MSELQNASYKVRGEELLQNEGPACPTVASTGMQLKKTLSFGLHSWINFSQPGFLL